MNRAKIKYAPAIKDMTIEHGGGDDDEGMETVLCQKRKREKQKLLTKSKLIEDRSSHSSSIDDSIFCDRPQNVELLRMIESRIWEQLLLWILQKPHTAHVKFTGRSLKRTSAGNLVLHESCKHNAPIDIIEALIEANPSAIKAKGHHGYLPFHCACANGASVELIDYLFDLYPDAVHQVEDEENALPLHLACKRGTTKEAVYMNLLTSFPEDVGIRDDFGRLPIDYAKNIRSDIHRKTAIECLRRANWLESAAKRSSERTERELMTKVRGYEQFQAQRMKEIEAVHKQEIRKLEIIVESQKEEILEQLKDIEELDQKLQKNAEGFQSRIESLEISMKSNNRKLQSQIDKAKNESAESQAVLHLKNKELVETSTKLEQTDKMNKSLTKQVQQRYEDLELALDDIDTLNKHSEWLETLLGSIQNLANTEPPLVREMQHKENHQSSSSSTYESAAQSNKSGRVRTGNGSSMFGRDSSISSSSRLIQPFQRIVRKGENSCEVPEDECLMEKRDAPLVGRVIQSCRE